MFLLARCKKEYDYSIVLIATCKNTTTEYVFTNKV